MTRTGQVLVRVAVAAGWQTARAAGSRWDFTVCNGRPHGVEVRLDGEALEFASGPLKRNRTRWDVMRANRDLQPPARVVLNQRGELQLRCEVLVEDAVDELVVRALEAVGAGLEAGGASAEAGGDPWDVVTAAAEAGLAGRRLEDGRFRLDAAGGAPRAATLGPDPAARVKMLPAGEHTATVREAVATLLLRMTSTVRFARATAAEDGSAWLEVRFAVPPAVGELQAAIAALSLASRCVEELSILTREEAAAFYLAAGGESNQEGGEQACQSLPPM